MRRLALIALLLPAGLLAKADGPGAPLVAADEAYTRAIQRDGTWAAARAFALPQSEMFIPKRVRTLEYGKDLPEPPYKTNSRTEQAWISCDSSVGVTLSRWKIAKYGLQGWVEVVWARMSDGSYRILLQQAGTLPRKLFSHPGRKGARAACAGKPPPLPIMAPAVGTDFKLGASYDQTMIWSSAVTEQGEVRIVVSLWNGTVHEPVLEDVAPAAPAR